MFCEVCDALLQPKKINGEIKSYCPDCDEIRNDDGSTLGKISYVDEDRNKDPEGGKILVLEENTNKTVGRSSKVMYCINCKTNRKVEYWEIQTRSADESPTRFFKCLTCDKQWREYD